MAINNINQSCGSLIYCTSTKRYLFLLRNNGKFPDSWGLVGGKVEQGESILAGLEREIQEELGGEITNAKIIPIEQYTSDNKTFTYHTFLIKVESEFVPELNNEHKGYCWVPLEAYPKPLHPGVYRSIRAEKTRMKIKVQERLN
jgi:8-oxo-dGTP pyrophosphatase MutT (NUDIX family)